MKIYIAGPMRGYPNLNREAFREAAKLGRYLGFTILSPVEHEKREGTDFDGYDPEDRSMKVSSIKWDLDAVLRADAIALLPGHEKSVGATAELAVARWAGKKILDARTFKEMK